MRITTYLLTALLTCVFVLSAAPPPKKKAAPPARKSTATSSKSRSTASSSRSRQTTSRSRSRRGAPATAARRRTGQGQPTADRYLEIQRALSTRGYFHSDPDGNWGPESQQALREFQKDQNLPPTGRISSLSLIALGLGPQRDASSVAGLTAAAGSK